MNGVPELETLDSNNINKYDFPGIYIITDKNNYVIHRSCCSHRNVFEDKLINKAGNKS